MLEVYIKEVLICVCLCAYICAMRIFPVAELKTFHVLSILPLDPSLLSCLLRGCTSPWGPQSHAICWCRPPYRQAHTHRHYSPLVPLIFVSGMARLTYQSPVYRQVALFILLQLYFSTLYPPQINWFSPFPFLWYNSYISRSCV